MAPTGWKEWKNSDMTADGAGELGTASDDVTRDAPPAAEGSSEYAHELTRALRGGADAVFVVSVDAAGMLVAELANETARLLLGLPAGAPDAVPIASLLPAEARPILASLTNAVTRSRATRETLMLPGPDGALLAVDLQLEPLPTGSGGARILALVRVSDPTLEPGAGTASSALTVGVLRYERGLGVVFVDDAVLALLGLAHEHALGQGWLDAVHPDDRAAVANAFEPADGHGEVLDVEFRLAAEHVRERWARVRAVPERDHDGGTGGFLATLEDITDQRVLSQSTARLVELADAVEDWVGIVDSNGQFVYANAVARQGLGLPPHEAVAGGPSAGLVAFDARSAEARIDAESLHAGIWTGPLLLQGLDGRRIEIAGTIRSHRAPDGTIDHYSFTGRDTADARFAAHEMLRLRRAVESTTDLITFHARGGQMLFANRAARELMGLAADETLPRVDMYEFFKMTPAQEAEMRQAIISEARWSGELEIHGRDRGFPASVVVSGHRDASGRYEYFSALSRDISSQRAAEAARRRSETALRAVVQSSPLPIFALDSRGAVHVWNRAAEELFGWPANDVLGGPPPLFRSADELEELIALAFSGETVRSHAARFARRDGELLDVNVAVAPLQNASGRVISAVVVAADVSDQRRAEHALRESEVRFRSLVQDSSDMVTIIGEDGGVRYRSPSSVAFLGLAPDEAFAPANDGLFEDDFEAVAEVFQRLRAGSRRSETVRYRFLRHDGELRWIEMVATSHLDDPAVGGIVTNARDITDRVEAESNLRSSEERLRALLAHSSDVISVIDRDGNLLYSSPTVERVYGYKAGAWPEDQSIFDVVHPDDRARVLELWNGSLSTPGEFRPLELRLRRGDGTWMYTEVIANNLLDDPSVNGIVVTSRDIDQRKQSEEALRASERRLRESEARYRAIVDDQTELVCRYLPDATLTFANRAFAEFFGAGGEELLGALLVDLRPASERARTLESLASFPAGVSVRTRVEREAALDGSLRWYQWTDRAFTNDAGEIVEFQSVGHDITDQRRAAEFTVHQAKILEQVARGVPLSDTLLTIARALEDQFPRFSCVIMLADDDRTSLRVGVAPTLAPRVVEFLEGTPIGETSCSCGAAAFLREPVYVRDVMTDDRWVENRYVATGHGLHASWSVPILSSDGTDLLGTLDVFVPEPRLPDDEHRQIFVLLAQLASVAIERKAFEEELAHQSMHDSLTGLPNRLLFLDRLAQSIARSARTGAAVSVAFLDLDRFKNINDSLGHDAGDELLVAVARQIESVIRPGDTVARFGGDEFTILCEFLPSATAQAQAVEIAERLLAAVIRPLVVRGTEMYVGASIGIALATTGDERPEELLRDADAAMYHAKETGRGRVEVFDDTMRTRAVTAHATENALHRALERGEFRLFFQPIVRLADARCIGAEALLRWQHPERGLLGPSEFIPLAEETGLVVEMGWWVIEEAARNAARWQLEQSDPIQVAINLSARQLTQPELADRVAAIITETGVRPSMLCFEITESVLMDDAESVLDIITRVRALGVQFSIDDFGTGYSSLGYLKRFPVDSVKIDRSFVSGLGSDPGDAAIVSAVIGLAHALGLRVTAEGVETEEQLTALIGLECDEAQGYFFSPPQPAPDLRSLIARTRTWRPPGAGVMRPADGMRPRGLDES